jgi:hypothetical protein
VAIDGDNAWVTCDAEDVVLQLAAATRTETKRWRMYEGAHARGVVGRDGEAFVATSGRGEAAHIFEPDLLRYLLGDDLHALALAPDGTLYGTRLRSPPNEGRVYKLPPGADDAEILTLAKDPGPDSDTQNRGVPTVLHTVVMSPDGGSLFVGGHVANNERGLARDGNELTPGLSVRAALRTIDTNTGLEDPARRKVFDNQGEVSAIAVSPRGTWLWVAHPGTGTLQRLDAFTFDVTGSILDAGRGIDALLWTSSNQLLVHAALDREVRAYNLETPSGFPELAWTARTVESEPLDAVVLEGKRLFHDARDPRIARDGYLSCAVCHPDGGDDGVTWDFTQRGEGLRNTISLLGHAGMAQGPVHWTGNFDEIQDFEIDIRSGQGGTGLLDEVHWADPQIVDPWGVQKAGLSDALDALAAYVASLDQSPASPYVSTPENEALFFASGCQICHDPDRDYTDSSLEAPLRHDVGTITPESGQRLGAPLDGFDTPTLRGAWATGPWLHDGSATTIETAIGAHELPGLNLTPQQKIQLASYVRTL